MTHKGTDCAHCPFKREKYPYCIDRFVEKYGKDCFILTLKSNAHTNNSKLPQ
jgi:hypothetical protein